MKVVSNSRISQPRPELPDVVLVAMTAHDNPRHFLLLSLVAPKSKSACPMLRWLSAFSLVFPFFMLAIVSTLLSRQAIVFNIAYNCWAAASILTAFRGGFAPTQVMICYL